MATGQTPPRRTGHPLRVAAVDIGYSAVRAVEVEIYGEQARLLKRGMAPIAPGFWDNPGAMREAASLAIRSALSAGGITATRVVTALPRRLVTLKYARLPHATPEQVRGMVQFEAQQYVPFPLEEVVLDHQIVSDEAEEMTTVIIVAARRSLVEGVLSVFDRAGLEVTRLSVSALALAEHRQNDGVPIGLLDVEAGEMDLAVVHAGRLLFTRASTLPTSTGDFADGQTLAAEVVRSLAAYQNEYRAQPVDRLLVAAPPGDLPRVEQTLGSLLEVPIERINGRLMPVTDPDSLTYATALGLALEGEGQGISRINLIPASRAERKEAARRRAHSLAAALILIAALALGGVYVKQSIDAQNRERVQQARENRRLRNAEPVFKRVKEEHDRIVQTYQTVSAALAHDKPFVEVMQAVSKAVPKGGVVYLTQLTIERTGAVSLHGNARSETAATDLVIALQNSGMFSEVRLGYLGDAQAETGTTPAAPSATPGAPRPTPPSGAPNTAAPPAPPGGSNGPAGNATRLGVPGPAPTPAPLPSGSPSPGAGSGTAPPLRPPTELTTSRPVAGEKMSFIITCKIRGSVSGKPSDIAGARISQRSMPERGANP